jgi:hypothetical protein
LDNDDFSDDNNDNYNKTTKMHGNSKCQQLSFTHFPPFSSYFTHLFAFLLFSRYLSGYTTQGNGFRLVMDNDDFSDDDNDSDSKTTKMHGSSKCQQLSFAYFPPFQLFLHPFVRFFSFLMLSLHYTTQGNGFRLVLDNDDSSDDDNNSDNKTTKMHGNSKCQQLSFANFPPFQLFLYPFVRFFSFLTLSLRLHNTGERF